ncbi:DUF883 family protein [Roseicyclus mahoneyensis]|uniref:Uncharacterized protein DUF883 n=1 Tax=Roseicyclus mahoneyensis TaxID=164332 RepID=A0A316GJP7_9RHOB|nr:DUF883 family protein [Roseicyclus mahoneyensis]PWK61338.1 uncharacterized protein DUF883 [Roseicyclus mahoneyensis]
MNAAITKDRSEPVADTDLSHQLEALRADVAKLVSTLSDDLSDGVGKTGRQIGQTGRDARATATTTVIEHPLTAVGIAVGVGLLLGMIARKG